MVYHLSILIGTGGRTNVRNVNARTHEALTVGPLTGYFVYNAIHKSIVYVLRGKRRERVITRIMVVEENFGSCYRRFDVFL